MALSNEWTDWHLTPNGWERGSERTDGPGIQEKPIPMERVLTVRWHEFQGSMSSRMKRYSTEKFRGDGKLVAELLAKFGDPPHEL